MNNEVQTQDPQIQLKPMMKQVPGGFWRRGGAAFVDGIIVSIVIYPVNFLIGMLLGVASPAEGAGVGLALVSGALTFVLNIVVVFFYFGYFYHEKGATPGKKLFSLKIVQSESGQNLTYFQAVVRESILKFFSMILLGMGYFMALFNKDKRTLHDYIIGSKVLYQDKNG